DRPRRGATHDARRAGALRAPGGSGPTSDRARGTPHRGEVAGGRRMTYFRAVDPFPLESAEHTELHEVYPRLASGRLATASGLECRASAWPPRGFCGECASDRFEWV